MTEGRWSMLVEILMQIETELPSRSGMISYLGGGVFVEDGRVCWAAATGMASRLTDLLRERASPGVDLNHVYQQCREEHRPLGETLVANGVVSTTDLASTLRRHTAESLVAITKIESMGTWTPRDGGYAPRFTFTPLETYLDVVDVMLGGVRGAAAAGLAPLATPARRGAAFVSIGDVALPVATSGNIDLREAWELGAWATGLTDAAHELAVRPGFALGTTDQHVTTVVWWHGDLTFALVGEDRAAVTEMTSYHLKRGRS